MSHITGTVQSVSPVLKIGPDFGPPTSPNAWTVNFAYMPAPTGTKLVMLHFTGASLPASNRLEVDLGYGGGEMDIFTSADGSDFWTRPINVYAVGATVTIRYITNGAANGGVRLDQYGRGERHTKDPDPPYVDSRFDCLTNCDPFLDPAGYQQPDFATFWFCNNPPNWENTACVKPPGDIRNAVAPAVGMIVHVDANKVLGFAVSTCSVTLVAPDTIVTAGHCMTDPIEDARSASVIFNYATDCNNNLPGGYSGRFFKVKEVIRQRYADGSPNDYCLLRLKVPPGGLGITPIPMRSDIPAVGEQVFGMHHPNGSIKKLSIPHPGFATVSASGVNGIGVDLDVAGGSSGSGLFDTAGRITGILSAGVACGLSYFPIATMQQDIANPPAVTRDVMLVFDRSGSMSVPGTSGQTKIEEARAAASLFVQLVHAGTGNRVGLVSFSTTASSPVDFPLTPVTAAGKNTLIGSAPFNGGIIGGIMPGGSTTIGGGLNAAYGQLPAGGANPRHVLLFTDGLQNTPPMVNPTDSFPTDIHIDAIGYGTPASIDGAMLTTLATQHHGQYVLADTNLKLQKFFALAFGNIFEAGLLMDPEFVLASGMTTAVPVPFNVCEEETITVVVGWDVRDAGLQIELTTPSGSTVTSGSPGVQSSASRTWIFLRVPLPHAGERDGTWKVTVFRLAGPGEFSARLPEVRYFVNVVVSGGAVLHRMPDNTKYYTGDVINPLVGLTYLQGGFPPNATVKVTVSRPDTSVGNLLSQEKLGPSVVIDADTIPPRQSTLIGIESRTGKPVVGYTQQTFDMFGDIVHTGAFETAGLFGNFFKDLLTVEGNYTFHFQASYGDTCTATRELLWSLHVEPGIDPSTITVTTNISGGTGTITLVPKDKYGNNVGPGRGDGLSIAGAPGTTVTGPVRDNGDGSYTVPVSWDPSSDSGPGVVIAQPGRPPVLVHDPKVKGKDRGRKWKILFWLALLVALILLLLWILK
jgi:von Willebrand factor type A domain/Trypsin-like peptidase domain